MAKGPVIKNLILKVLKQKIERPNVQYFSKDELRKILEAIVVLQRENEELRQLNEKEIAQTNEVV